MKFSSISHQTSIGVVEELILTSDELELHLLNYGATLCGVYHSSHRNRNLVLQYQDISDYIQDPSYLGHTIGPAAGRIAEATFSLQGMTYQVNSNDGPHLLHSGREGISFQLLPYTWKQTNDFISVTFVSTHSFFHLHSPYCLSITYTLFQNSEFQIDYHGEGVGICNPTSHAYFNLGTKETIFNHNLTAPITAYYEQKNMIHTGITLSQDDRFDFRHGQTLSSVIQSLQQQEEKGLDHTLIYNHSSPLCLSAEGITLLITTSYPCVHTYTSNQENIRLLKEGRASRYGGIAFECQYPSNDINNHPDTSKTIVTPNSPFHQWIHYQILG